MNVNAYVATVDELEQSAALLTAAIKRVVDAAAAVVETCPNGKTVNVAPPLKREQLSPHGVWNRIAEAAEWIATNRVIGNDGQRRVLLASEVANAREVAAALRAERAA